jgi:lysophospholipase L1-like esterase
MRLFLSLLLVFYTGGTCFAAGTDPGVFRELVVSYFNGVATRDFRKLVAVTTEDFVIYEFGKKWNNDSVFRNIQYHEPFGVKFTLTDFVVFMDERSGDATYHSQADFVFGDTDKVELSFIETATFRKTAAGWKIKMIQVSPVASPEVGMPADYKKYDTVRYIPEHYRERVAVFAGEALSRGRVVFFGNSITEFGNWKLLLGDSGVVNRGIAGDNTFGMLERLPEVIALRPRVLYIETGINDIGQGVPASLIAANIGSLVQWVRVKSPSTRVYVVSVLPTNAHAQADYPEIFGKNAVVREVDRLLQAQAVSRGYTYLDLISRLAGSTGELDERYAQPDGLHLNEAGYGVWVGMIKGTSAE